MCQMLLTVTMDFLRTLQVAVAIVALHFGCSLQRASAELACTGPALTDVVRRFSQARFETRDTKPKLARCKLFIELIRGQPELVERAPGWAIDEPRGLLNEITRALELRASCPGQPMGGLSSLHEFIGDCQELVELTACAAQSPSVVAPEMRPPANDETKKLLASITRLQDENARLARETSQTRHLEAEHAKLYQESKELELRLQETFGGARDKDKEIHGLQSRIDQLLAESKKLQESLVDKEKIIEDLIGQKAGLARELDETRHLAELNYSQRLEELRRHGQRDKRLDCEALERANEELSGQNEKLARRLDELRQFSGVRESRTIRELEDKIAQQSLVISELKSNKVQIETLERVNAMLGRELADANEKLKEQTRAQTALQVVPGQTREIELQRDAGDELGLFWSNDIYGSVFVTQVVAGSPAARAGLKFGDQLIQVNGRTTAGRDLYVLTRGVDHIKFLIRKSPMEQTFTLRPRLGEQVPGFVWSGSQVEIQDIYYDQAAARAGLLESFKLIAVNGESVLGLDGATLASSSWWPKGEFTVTIMPNDFYTKLTEGLSGASLARTRMESNKILADEKAGRV